MRRLPTLLPLLAILSGCQGTSPTSPEAPTSAPIETELARAPAPRTQEFPYTRILCFGDSLTYGVTLRALAADSVTLSPVEGYVPKLSRRLVQRYGGTFEIVNSGIGAESTREGRARLTSELDRLNPDLVLLLEGTVDAGNRNPSFRRIRRDLAAMIQDVRRRGIDLVVGTIPPLHADGFRATAWGIDNVPVVNQIIREEAAAVGAPVADHEVAFGSDPGLQGPDGVHPNDNGYEVMAETWLEAIERLLAMAGT